MGRRPGAPTVHLRDGKTVYVCRFTAHGTRYVDVSTGETDHGRALEAAAKLQAEALLRRPVSRRVRVRHSDQASLATLSAAYIEHAEASGKAKSYTKKQLMHFRAHFLPRWDRLSDLTTAAIDRYPTERMRETTQRKKPPTTPTIYKELVTLSRFLRWCVRCGYLDAVPTFDRVRPVSDHKVPDISRAEALRVLAALPTRHEHPRRYAVRERYTVQWAQGMRDGEIATLRWADVDLVGGTLTIRQSNDKAREGRAVELAAASHAVLSDLAKTPHPSTARVFGKADLRWTLDKACVAAKVERITTHVFRHARLTELASNSQDFAAIQFAAGHKHSSTTDKYVRSRTTRTGALFAASDSGVPKRPDTTKRATSRRRQRA